MFRLLKNLKKQDWLLVVLCLMLVAVQVFLDLKLPDYTKEITVLISSQSNVMSDYWIAGAKMLACALGSAGLSVVVGYFAAKVASDFSFAVRDKLFKQVTNFGDREIKKYSTASLITRTTNDITHVQMFVAMGLQVIIKAPIMAVWAIEKILGKSFELSMLVLGAVVILLTVIITLLCVLMPKFKKAQKQIDDVNRITRENLTGLKVIRAFDAEEYQEQKFDGANAALTHTQLFTMHGMAFLFPTMILIQSVLSLATYWLGAYLVNDIQIPLDGTLGEIMSAISSRAEFFGDVVSFNSYAIYVIMSFVMLMSILMFLPRAQVSANRINEVLNEKIDVKEGTGVHSTEKKGFLEFKNVSFRYPDAQEDCIKNLSFKVEQGQTLAFIGTTGSGKSTVVGLMSRLYDPTGGEILLDGEPLSKYNFEKLYQKIGVIPQKATLFSDTIRNNVAFGDSGKEITDVDINKALEIAKAKEFVDKTENGLDTKIAQSGSNLSGGQKQRLAIARAVVRKPEILIFDDAFSALDYKTDKALRKNIATKLNDTTCIIVAQRIGTIRNADQIVVLDEGKAVRIGTHDELMKKCKVYKDIALSQLSKAELE